MAGGRTAGEGERQREVRGLVAKAIKSRRVKMVAFVLSGERTGGMRG